MPRLRRLHKTLNEKQRKEPQPHPKSIAHKTNPPPLYFDMRSIMFCKKCGTKLPDESNFCPKCGEKVPTIGFKEEEDRQPESLPENTEYNTVDTVKQDDKIDNLDQPSPGLSKHINSKKYAKIGLAILLFLLTIPAKEIAKVIGLQTLLGSLLNGFMYAVFTWIAIQFIPSKWQKKKHSLLSMKSPNFLKGVFQFAGLVVLMAAVGYIAREWGRHAAEVDIQNQVSERKIDHQPVPLDFQKIEIPGVGSIVIHQDMEVNDLMDNDELRNLTFKRMNIDPESMSRTIRNLVVKQKGLSQYARIMVETIPGKPGDFYKLDYRISDVELRELEQEFKSTFESQLPNVGIKILQWYPFQIEYINGLPALTFSFKRQLNQNPPVYAKYYIFYNNDQAIRLTTSYRLSEAHQWADKIKMSIQHFSITNIH